jgi:hypothetical protein
MTHPIEKQKKNLHGSNKYNLWVIKWLCSKACESELDYPRQNICDNNDMENLPSVTCLVTTNQTETNKKKTETTNNTTTNLITIIPTYIKLVRPKPKPNRNNNLNDGNKVTEL